MDFFSFREIENQIEKVFCLEGSTNTQNFHWLKLPLARKHQQTICFFCFLHFLQDLLLLLVYFFQIKECVVCTLHFLFLLPNLSLAIYLHFIRLLFFLSFNFLFSLLCYQGIVIFKQVFLWLLIKFFNFPCLFRLLSIVFLVI